MFKTIFLYLFFAIIIICVGFSIYNIDVSGKSIVSNANIKRNLNLKATKIPDTPKIKKNQKPDIDYKKLIDLSIPPQQWEYKIFKDKLGNIIPDAILSNDVAGIRFSCMNGRRFKVKLSRYFSDFKGKHSLKTTIDNISFNTKWRSSRFGTFLYSRNPKDLTRKILKHNGNILQIKLPNKEILNFELKGSRKALSGIKRRCLR